jgi:hypothetical protein
MDFLTNLKDKAEFALHKYTYDPDAEDYAASQKAAKEAADAAKKAKDSKEAAKKKTVEDAAAEKARKEKEAADRASRSQFNTGRFAAKVGGVLSTILFTFLLVVGGIYGAHLATNLNIYRSWPYRLLYAIYGFIFFPVVIVYVLGYRWWWKGKKPRFYALLPLIPYFINQPLLAQLLSWASFRPDDVIESLQEWNPDMVKKGEEAQRDMDVKELQMAEAEEAEEAEEA